MKILIQLFFTLLFSTTIFSQIDSTAPYFQSKVLPEFTLLTIDSVEFNQKTLDDTKSTIIMLFNPECDHCQHQLETLLSVPGIAQKAQIILSSIETQEKNRVFYNKNHLENYPFIHLGKDYKYIFGKYYRPNTIPVLAFYNSNKQLVLFNQGETKKKQIQEALHL